MKYKTTKDIKLLLNHAVNMKNVDGAISIADTKLDEALEAFQTCERTHQHLVNNLELARQELASEKSRKARTISDFAEVCLEETDDPKDDHDEISPCKEETPLFRCCNRLANMNEGLDRDVNPRQISSGKQLDFIIHKQRMKSGKRIAKARDLKSQAEKAVEKAEEEHATANNNLELALVAAKDTAAVCKAMEEAYIAFIKLSTK